MMDLSGADRRNVLVGLIVVAVVIPFGFFVYQSQSDLTGKVDMLEQTVVVLSSSNQELRSENERVKASVSGLNGVQDLVSQLSDSNRELVRQLASLNDSVNKPVETRVSQVGFDGDAGLVTCTKAECPEGLSAFSGKCTTNSTGLEMRGFGLVSGRGREYYNYWECCYAVKENANGTHVFDAEVYCR